MKTWITLATCITVSVLSLGICRVVNAQDAPPRPRVQLASPSSVPPAQTVELAQRDVKTETSTQKVETFKKEILEPAANPKTANPLSRSSQKFDLSFEDLKFEMEKGGAFDRTMLTDEINSYHGNVVSIRGFIRPANKQSGLTKFVFVRDNKECCFGPGAALYDCVLVRLKKGLDTEYTVRPVTIEGKFALKEYRVDGKAWSIYRMTDTKVK